MRRQRKRLDRLKRLRDHGKIWWWIPVQSSWEETSVYAGNVSQEWESNHVFDRGLIRGPRIFVGIPDRDGGRDSEDIYLYEIENGIGPERIKPGIIKVATGYGRITDYERIGASMRPATMASIQSGLPIITLTERGRWGPNRLVTFKRYGVAADRCLDRATAVQIRIFGTRNLYWMKAYMSDLTALETSGTAMITSEWLH